MTTSESFIDESLQNGEEFDEARSLPLFFCQPASLQEYEQQAETATEHALEELMEHLDSNKEEFMEQLRRKKRQDLENGGVFSFVKVKVMDMIHGNNSPLLQVSEKERDKKLDTLKFNMQKAFECNMECKGRRASKRLQEKRQKSSSTVCNNGTASPASSRRQGSRAGGKGGNSKSRKSPSRSKAPSCPPPPPPPPLPPMLEQTTPRRSSDTRRPFTPIQNTISEFKTPKTPKSKLDSNDILGSTPALDVSLTSLHQELLSSNPWKRLKCVNEDRSPGGTPEGAMKRKTATTLLEPLHIALVNKFRNIRSPSPNVSNITVTSPGDFTP